MIEIMTSIFEWFILVSSVLLYFFVPEGALWNGRVISFFNLGVVVLFFKLLQYAIDESFKYEQGTLILKILSLVVIVTYLVTFLRSGILLDTKNFFIQWLLQ